MQKSRRRCGLQLHLLPLGAAAVVACASAPPLPPSPELAPASVPRAAPGVAVSSPEPPPEESPRPAPAPADVSPEVGEPGPAAVSAPDLPAGTRVLQIGDSFADALGKELGKLLKASGLRTSLETKTPSYIGDWAFGPTLKKLLGAYDPDLVLITLGANELEIPAPEQRVGPVQRLVTSLGGRPCVWILPPLWKQDTGVMQVIKDNAKPCQVLDSSTLVPDLPRGRDHIHPSTEGRVRWATAVFDWLRQAREPAGPRPWSLRGGPL
jgi:lysophospholipase L1-like esterase